AGVRERLGLDGRPVVLCVARLVPRKGQDALIRALPRVRRAVPDATLLLVGAGPDERRLRALARRTGGLRGAAGAVLFAGGLPHGALPPYYAAADVFAMPCRSRRLGLEAEGLGIVFLEAAAAGLPVLAGASGGAPETVRDGETGRVVDGRDVGAVADRLVQLLTGPGAMGEKGRARAAAEWTWDASARQLRHLLDQAASRTVEP
ncbi:glycosyltransferase family 4 protein, partial [Streptomyces boncukensis]